MEITKPIPIEINRIPKRKTLIKHRVGCVKGTDHQMFSTEHVYGLKLDPDPENAGQIISNWVTSKPSEIPDYNERKTIQSNVLAIKHGCITAKSMRDYALQHPNIHLKESVNDNSETKSVVVFEGPFGIKTKAPEDAFENIIQGRYISYHNDDGDYPDLTTIQKHHYMPKPRPTNSSSLLMKTTNAKVAKDEKSPFIMSKFRNVKSSMSEYFPSQVDKKIENTN